MSEEIHVSVNIGGPTGLDIDDAEWGSRWYLPILFEDVPDSIDLGTITAARGVIREAWSSPEILIPIDVELDRLASESIIALVVDPADTKVAGAAYVWGMRFASTDPALDQWVPLIGKWNVVNHNIPTVAAPGS